MKPILFSYQLRAGFSKQEYAAVSHGISKASRTADGICRIGRTTYLIRHHFTGNRNLENVLERLILSDKSLL